MRITIIFILLAVFTSSLCGEATLDELIANIESTAKPGTGIGPKERELAEQILKHKADAIPLLLPLLKHGNEDVRALTAYTMSDIEGLTAEHLPILIEAHKAGAGWIPSAIASIGNDDALKHLVEYFLEDPEINGQVDWSIVSFKEKSIPYIIAAFKKHEIWNDNLSVGINHILKKMKNSASGAIEPLLQIAESDETPTSIRNYAVLAIRSIHSSSKIAQPRLNALADLYYAGDRDYFNKFEEELKKRQKDVANAIAQEEALAYREKARLERLASRPKKCPFGHNALKEIPIVYGLLAYNAELEKKFKNKSLWKGGCVVGPEKTKLYCTTCEYAYQGSLEYWEMSSDKIEDFEIPLDPLIAKFPGKGGYSQNLKGNIVTRESRHFWVDENADALVRKFIKYLKSFKTDPVTNMDHFDRRIYHYIYAKYKDKYISIEIMEDETKDDVHVRAELLHANEIDDELMLLGALNIDGYEWEPDPSIDFKTGSSGFGSTMISNDNIEEYKTEDSKYKYHVISIYLGKKNGSREYEVTYTKNRLNGDLVFSDKRKVIYLKNEITLWEDEYIAVRLR